ncbi:LysR substrate-binding domain-containing protein [Propionivibrio sp.]|uniref:LysR substrate-binding domain-containing protein n=1 Tax=Propionivibrio sp. TaxID=2212460 RepID=UPI0025FA0FBC|nr:LysR substrate-binding domain-containing protein [Propionivibrio sp.]MBK7354543.1 LysR family transcriptional regulator [Propionivibrio sp.]MBK8401912.1 LysR family transcriptional regulator [Propionivibrio sp.]MBK8743727.1 LysR family transcriptional regulator [Propionivibrio sp.]MBK8895538.1 LysR family transcriptional regulator [Propionivibrio sp.]
MPTARDVLTPDALFMLQTIAAEGSFAAAARVANMVPSALTYRVRQMEEALDVLLFDRSSRQARLTEAGEELFRESERLLADVDAVANRVKRVATGWESQFTIAIDGIIDRTTVLELCEAFFALNPPTRIRLRDETLAGTLGALSSGQADLALGVVMEAKSAPGLAREPMGSLRFIFAVAPHHPLAAAAEPLSDDLIRRYRAVAVADSIQRGDDLTIGLLPGQDVFTVPSLSAKLEAQIRGMGAGFLPACMAQTHINAGRLVEKSVERVEHKFQVCYAWRKCGKTKRGRALQWWLGQLQSPVTRAALLGQRHGTLP